MPFVIPSLYGPEAIVAADGTVVTDTSVTVYPMVDEHTSSTIPANLYSDRALTPITNPLPVSVAPGSCGLDVYGNVMFRALPGDYQVETIVGALRRDLRITINPDGTELTGLVGDALTEAAADLRYLQPSAADSRYLQPAAAAATYLTAAAAATLYAPLSGGMSTYVDHGSVSGPVTVDLSTGGVHTLRMIGDVTLSPTGFVPGTSGTLIIKARQDGSGNRSVNWPAGMWWEGGSAPDPIFPAGDRLDVYRVESEDGGSTLYGYVIGEDMSPS